jgi:hypothetical protein
MSQMKDRGGCATFWQAKACGYIVLGKASLAAAFAL